MKITVVGGMNMDFLAVPHGPLVLHDSNPGKVQLRAGGVGRNIAQRLSEMGAEVFLITALGNDAQAPILLEMCREKGIGLSHALKTNLPTPSYLCIHDDQGDMALAVSDMSAVDALTPEVMAEKMACINESDGCVLDANLPEETLLFIAKNAQVPLFLDPVSCHKAPKVKSILPYLTAIKPNLLEASVMTGEKDPAKAADILLFHGVKNAFISMGAEGVYFAGEEDHGIVPALPLPQLPLTGAGDALCAGITLSLLKGLPLRECARKGCEAAYHALMATF